MKTITEHITKKPWLGWLIFLLTVVIVFFLGLLASSIIGRRSEAALMDKPKVEVSQWESRNAIWGQNYPREYQSFLQTADTDFRSAFGGSTMIDMLELDPKLVVLWAGYAFSKDYNQGRGHFYAVTDIHRTLRTGAPMGPDEGPQPNTCWACKSPDVPRVMHQTGVAEFYKGKWASRGNQIMNPIGCADCHDAVTQNLRISRPALIEAFKRQGKDIRSVSHQEMRSLVCAQCHVEYYFKGDGKYLTFPWDRGFTADSIETYYDSYEFTDWTHALSKTPMLKAQHPDYELFKTGIHYDRGVSCADCHMPYQNEGGQKFTDHHIQSPLNNTSNSCQVCHRESEKTLYENVYERQQKTLEIRDKVEENICRAHIEAKTAWDAGATEEEMKPVMTLIRHAQWRWDYVAASHGGSFHSPVESLRLLGTSMDKAQEARVLLSRILSTHQITQPVAFPDISTKAKAQLYIGLEMNDLRSDKQKFLDQIVPKWMEEYSKQF
ncbi:MAG: ammonia-forming cytochrome c nitrite reductase [Bacteroidales bacterium]|nr:ammonia-forming cytochrome c nitrite reductase [Bacteroidales bacterium]